MVQYTPHACNHNRDEGAGDSPCPIGTQCASLDEYGEYARRACPECGEIICPACWRGEWFQCL